MSRLLWLYALLLVSVVAQSVLFRFVVWFPDLILLTVVFAGIFRRLDEAVVLGVVAGFLRNCFSVQPLFLDIFLFPLVGIISFLLGGMFYRRNPVVQIFTSLVCMAMVVAAHLLYFNLAMGNDIAIVPVFIRSKGVIAVTALFSPLFFAIFKGLQLQEE